MDPTLLSFFDRLSGMLALLALLFVVGWLNKTNELTALWRPEFRSDAVVRPLMMASTIVILAAAALRGIPIPQLSRPFGPQSARP